MAQRSVYLSTQAQITGALGYTSEIFWHFFGRRQKSIEGKLEILGKILESGKLLTEWEGWAEYRVQITPEQEAPLDQDSPPPVSTDIHFAEPKMVCLADIPIHCLPIHSQRYHRFAFGFSKQRLFEKYPNNLRTVMLLKMEWALRSLPELQGTLLKLRDGTTIYEPSTEIGKFLKFEHSTNVDECFENIYLEREWRCLESVELAGLLELVIVPKEALNSARTIVTQKLTSTDHPVSVLAWESLFGAEVEESQ